MSIKDESPTDILGPIFEKAKEVDEFEFCCTLARVRGSEGPGRDPLKESYELTQQLIGLIQAPLDEKLKIRLLLFLYCHVTEMDDLYDINANLLRVTTGERYAFSPFSLLPRYEGKLQLGYPLNGKIDQLVALSKETGFNKIGDLFSFMFVRPVRNAFYHSDYILTNDSFNIKHGEGVNTNGIVTSTLSLEWLLPKLNLGINTALATIDLLIYHRRLYKEDKIIRGRLGADGSWVDIQLTTDSQQGLTGFISPPAIKAKE